MVDYDYQNHDNAGPQLNFTIWAFVVLCTPFLALRLWCKFLRKKQLWWDDLVLLMSWVALVSATSLLAVAVTMGYGKHSWDIDPANFDTILLLGYAAGFSLILSATWSKTSFAITLLRISDGWTKWFVWIVIFTVNGVLGTSAIVQWLQCWPVEKLWNDEVPGQCLPKNLIIGFNSFTSGYSGIMDIVLALLPWKIIWKVAIDKREKLCALFAMSMGVFAGITSLLKIMTLPVIASEDMINSVNLCIFGTAECAVTILAASIPILRALLQDGRPRLPRGDPYAGKDRWGASQGSSTTLAEQKA